MSILEFRAYSMLNLNQTWSEIGKMTIFEAKTCLRILGLKKKDDLELLRNVHLNALANSNRGKNDKFIELFDTEQKITVKPMDEALKERAEILTMRRQ